MAQNVKCERCGAENELGKLFCVQCGARLSGNVLVKSRPKGGRNPLRTVVRTVCLCAVLAVAGLVFWRAPGQGQIGTRKEALRFDSKAIAIERAIKRQHHISATLHEAEVNSYMKYVVERSAGEKQSSSFSECQITQINFSFSPERFVLVMHLNWGPVPFSYELTGVVNAKDKTGRVKIETARLGHLPLPGILKNRLATRVLAAFSKLKREQYIIERVLGIRLGEQKVDVAT